MAINLSEMKHVLEELLKFNIISKDKYNHLIKLVTEAEVKDDSRTTKTGS